MERLLGVASKNSVPVAMSTWSVPVPVFMTMNRFVLFDFCMPKLNLSTAALSTVT